MHCLKLETESEERSPPKWSMPHSMVKLRPREVTRVLFEAGQVMSDEAAVGIVLLLGVPEGVRVEGWLKSALE